MYRKHYRLQELPFTITPDTRFFFAHTSHQEALNTLLVAVRSGEGFIKVVGEVGTGKTLLCRKFLNALDPQEYITAFLPNPYLEPRALLMGVAEEFGMTMDPYTDQHHLLRRLNRFLIDNYASGKRAVVCLDEAQAIPVETLEALRLLTNLETERRKLLQVVLFGQPELDAHLGQPRVRQLRQRITFSAKLRPFTLPEVDFYVSHRLTVAGYRGPRLFTPEAVEQLHRASGGIPRLINILAHKAMLSAFGEGSRIIDAGRIRDAVLDTESLTSYGSITRRLLRYVGLGMAGVLLSAGLALWGGMA
jgi:MSHA biogenesis protein MshM